MSSLSHVMFPHDAAKTSEVFRWSLENPDVSPNHRSAQGSYSLGEGVSTLSSSIIFQTRVEDDKRDNGIK
jgi:hypothetical protein